MGTVREMTEIAAGNNSILFFTAPSSFSLPVSGPKYAREKEPVTIPLAVCDIHLLARSVGRSITSLLTFGARGESRSVSRSVGAGTKTCPARKGERAVKGFLRNDCRDIRRCGGGGSGQQAEEGWRSLSLSSSPSKAGREHRFSALLLLPHFPFGLYLAFYPGERGEEISPTSSASSSCSSTPWLNSFVMAYPTTMTVRLLPFPLGTSDGICKITFLHCSA